MKIIRVKKLKVDGVYDNKETYDEMKKLDKVFGGAKVMATPKGFYCSFHSPSQAGGPLSIAEMKKQNSDFDAAMKNNRDALAYMIANEKKLEKLIKS